MSALKKVLAKEHNSIKNDQYMSCLELTANTHAAILGTKKNIRFNKFYRNFDCQEFKDLPKIYGSVVDIKPVAGSVIDSINFEYDPSHDKVVLTFTL
jgi:hypothetical protein